MKLDFVAKKTLADRTKKRCAVCGRAMWVMLYKDKSYRGGHYFGKIPLYRKREMNRALKAGTRKSKIGSMVIEVLKRSPRAYTHAEYWECPRCYWQK